MASESAPGQQPRRVPRARSILECHPDLAAEADHDRAASMGLDFYTVACGTRIKLPWRHDVADGAIHRWLQAGTSRVHMKAGCPVCRGYVASDTTSLAARLPELASEWHPTFNGARTSDDVTPGSRHSAAWLCGRCGHAWSARISSRALNGNGCPRCAGQVALPGDSATLAVAQPELYADVDLREARRLGIDPLRIHARSRRAVPWQCRRDERHRWTATPASRMSGCVCPHCPSLGRSSATERRLLDLIRRQFSDAVGDAPAGDTRWADSRGRLLPARCDIVIASSRLVVEYDGLRYHSSADRRRCDTDKTAALLAVGWRVVRIRERAGTRSLSDLALASSDLLQLSHRYGDPFSPLVDEIGTWLACRDG